MDVETLTNNTHAKAMDQFKQTVIAVERWQQTLAEGTSERALFDNEFKIHFEKLAQICKMAIGQFGAMALDGCTLAQGTKLDLTYTFSVVDPVTNSTPAKLFKDAWVQIRNALAVLALFTTTHLNEKCEDEFAELDGQLNVAN